MQHAFNVAGQARVCSTEGYAFGLLYSSFTTALHTELAQMLCILMVHASKPAKGTFNAFVGQPIGSLISRVTRMALDPAPVNFVAAGGHQ